MFRAYVCPGYSTKISASLGAASVTSIVAGGACAETFCSPLEPQPIRVASSAIGKTPDALDSSIGHPPSALITGQSLGFPVSPIGFKSKEVTGALSSAARFGANENPLAGQRPCGTDDRFLSSVNAGALPVPGRHPRF